MREAISGGYIAGNGHFGKRAERALEGLLHSRVLLTTSCTHALEMSAMLLDLSVGDEIIMPSFTFVSCANAFVLRGAKPVFVDVLPGSFSIDPDAVVRAITPRTRAILIVHYAGVACDMERLLAIATRHRLPIIEDNAHGLFGSYRGRPLGSFGRFATLSFHETKNIHCGEGGALVLNDPRDVPRAEIIREKGTDRAAFFRGAVDKYRWTDIGSSYVLSDLLAAFLCVQLDNRDAIQKRRREIWWRYHDELEPAAERAGWERPSIDADGDSAYHLYFLVMRSIAERDQFIAALAADNIQAVFHYQQLHRSPYAMALGLPAATCPVTDIAAERLVRLPLFNDMTVEEQTRVIRSIEAFASRRSEARVT